MVKRVQVSRLWMVGVALLLSIVMFTGVLSVHALPSSPETIVTDPVDNAGHPDCVNPSQGWTMPQSDGYNGWDIDEVGFAYDRPNDVLYVSVSMHNGVIAGDVDNDGNPSNTAACLSGSGLDIANLGPVGVGNGEAIDVVFDTDSNGTYEFVAGVANDAVVSGFAVASYTGGDPTLGGAGSGFGTAAGTGSVTNNPTTLAAPDFEFTVDNFSGFFTGLTSNDTLDFCMVARAGSQLDGGTGEEIVPRTCISLTTANMSIGNLVWDDLDNSGTVNGGEIGISGVTLTLYNDTNGDGVYTPGMDVSTGKTATTDANGNYLFSGLLPGDYVVVIDAANFSGGGALVGKNSSTGSSDPDNDVDNDDNGAPNSGSVVSRAVTLSWSTEPTTDGDSDWNSNLTMDFGFTGAPSAVKVSGVGVSGAMRMPLWAAVGFVLLSSATVITGKRRIRKQST
ncbi:MAG: SdrD B-like domain-containing protein [Anaerolineae bacterium]